MGSFMFLGFATVIAPVFSEAETRMVSPFTAAKINENLFRGEYWMDFLCWSMTSVQDTHDQQRLGESFWQFLFFFPLNIALGKC